MENDSSQLRCRVSSFAVLYAVHHSRLKWAARSASGGGDGAVYVHLTLGGSASRQ